MLQPPVKTPGERLLCKSENDVMAEYALKKYIQPMGVSDCQLAKPVPEELRSQLPAIEELEQISEQE